MKRGRIKRRNSKRSRESEARNFGEEAKAVRLMSCITGNAGPVVAAHVVARAMGGAKGGRFDLVPLTQCNHADAGEARTTQRKDFERCHGLDLRAEADRIAIEHPRPLGIRGLADRWMADAGGPIVGRVLTDYERSALLGWVRREMARVVVRMYERAFDDVDAECEEYSRDRSWLARHIAAMLGGDFTEALAHTLCEEAGWP